MFLPEHWQPQSHRRHRVNTKYPLPQASRQCRRIRRRIPQWYLPTRRHRTALLPADERQIHFRAGQQARVLAAPVPDTFSRSKAVFAIFLPALSSSPLHEDAKAANAKAYSQQIIHIPAIRKVFLYFKVLISDIYLYFKVMDLSHSVLPVQYRFLLLLSSSSTSLARSTPAAAAISR